MDDLTDIVEKRKFAMKKDSIAFFIRTLIEKMITDIIRLVHMECTK